MEAYTVRTARSVVLIDIKDISPNPAQPRRQFAQDSLDSLAESISRHGLLSPLLVRRVNAGRYELVAGERRLRALKLLGRSQAEALIVSAYDSESALMALIENIQREQLHYLEEACACRAILDSEHISQEELARRLGRSPSALANRLRLIKLAPAVREMLLASSLTERHARALLAVADPEKQLETAQRAEKLSLTVQQLEQYVAGHIKKRRAAPRCVACDHRLYINAVIDTVDRLRAMGAAADTSVSETDAGTEIHILLKKTNNPIIPQRQSTHGAH